MFMKSAMRAPFYFFAGEDGGAAGGGAAVGAGAVVASPAGALGSAPSSEPVHGTAGDPGPMTKPADGQDPAAGGAPVKPAAVAPKTADPAPAARSAADGGGPGGEPAKATDPLPWEKQAEALAKGDKKLTERLVRLGGIEGIINSWRSMEVERDSGRWAKQLPTHYTAEELAEFKAANKIPDKPEGYDDNLGNGFVWGESDKHVLDHFKTYALENNMTPAEVKKALGWYPLYQEAIINELNEADLNNAALAKNDFRATWGAAEARNLTFLRNQFESEKGAWATIANARAPDGRRLGDNPQIMKLFLEKFKNGDPEAYDLPSNGTTPSQNVEQEMADIKKLMGNKQSAYWKGPDAPAMQERYRNLIERKQRIDATASM
jgi:hypothetical protein